MNERAGAWLEAGLRHRLWFSPVDDHDTAAMPFALCDRGDRVEVGHVSCGWIGGREIRAFDLDVLVRADDHVPSSGFVASIDALAGGLGEGLGGGRSEGYVVTERWACAVVRAGAECHRLSVAPEGLLTTLADLAIVPDQDLELDAFNRAFEVRADDRAFASAFLDARMASFLLEHAQGCVVETVGNRILAALPAADNSDPEAVLALVVGVAERVPKAVRALHPPLPAALLTPRCQVGRDGAVRTVEPEPNRRAAFDPWPDVPSGWA